MNPGRLENRRQGKSGSRFFALFYLVLHYFADKRDMDVLI